MGSDGIAESSSFHIKNKVFWRFVSQISPPIFNRFFQLKLRVSIHLAGGHFIGKNKYSQKTHRKTNHERLATFLGRRIEVKVFWGFQPSKYFASFHHLLHLGFSPLPIDSQLEVKGITSTKQYGDSDAKVVKAWKSDSDRRLFLLPSS